MGVLLTTARLILRRFTAADADYLFALDNDPAVMRYINGGTPTPRRVIEAEILPRFMRYDERYPGYGFWAAEEKAGRAFLGWFSFRPTQDRPGELALGYRFRQAVWGRGYASEGARALIDKGFTEWGVACVVAGTYEENLASRRVMEKVGLTFRRAFRPSAAEILNSETSHITSAEVWEGDEVEYALERAEWEGKVDRVNTNHDFQAR